MDDAERGPFTDTAMVSEAFISAAQLLSSPLHLVSLSCAAAKPGSWNVESATLEPSF
jgi:hypothetical protein